MNQLQLDGSLSNNGANCCCMLNATQCKHNPSLPVTIHPHNVHIAQTMSFMDMIVQTFCLDHKIPNIRRPNIKVGLKPTWCLVNIQQYHKRELNYRKCVLLDWLRTKNISLSFTYVFYPCHFLMHSVQKWKKTTNPRAVEQRPWFKYDRERREKERASAGKNGYNVKVTLKLH